MHWHLIAQGRERPTGVNDAIISTTTVDVPTQAAKFLI
jgi:hypothetical protein